MEINVGGEGAAFNPMEDLQLAQYDPKNAKPGQAGHVPGHIPGQVGKEGEHGLHLKAHDSMVSAAHDILQVGTTTDLNVSLQFPPGDPAHIPQYVLDNADARSPTILPKVDLLNLDRKGGLQAQMHALNQGIDSNKVKSQAFERAMTKYDPPLTEDQKALVLQHKETYFKNANDPAIPTNTKKLLERLTQQASAEINKQFGLPEAKTLPPEAKPADKTQAAKQGEKEQTQTGKPQSSKTETAKDKTTNLQLVPLPNKGAASTEDLDFNAALADNKTTGQKEGVEKDPAKIASQAFDHAMANYQPPLTQTQQISIMQYVGAYTQNHNDPTIPETMRVLLQHLLENAAIEMKKQMGVSTQTIATGQAEEASAAAGAKGTKEAEALAKAAAAVAVAATKAAGGAGGPQNIDRSHENAWEAGTAYLAFELAFMELVHLMMKTKMVETTVMLNAQTLQYSYAQNTASLMASEAKNEQYQYMVDAITNGVAFSGTVASGMIGLRGGSGLQEEQPLTGADAPASPLEEMENMPKPGEKYNEFGHTADQVDTHNAEIKKLNSQMLSNNKEIKLKQDQYIDRDKQIKAREGAIKAKQGNVEALKKSNADDMELNRKNVDETQKIAKNNDELKAKIKEIKNRQFQQDPAETQLSDDALKARQAPIDNYRKGELATNNKEVGSINASAKSENDRIRAQNAKINASNTSIQNQRQIISQMLGGSFQQIANMTSSAVKSSLAVVQGYYKGQQAIMQTAGQLTGQLAQSANDAFKSDSDVLTQTIQMLDSIRQKLMDAVAAMLRGR